MDELEAVQIRSAAKAIFPKKGYTKVITDRFPEYKNRVDKLRNVWGGRTHDEESAEMLLKIQVLTIEMEAS